MRSLARMAAISALMLCANPGNSEAEEKTIEIPFPASDIDPDAVRYYCTATLGTALSGTSRNYELARLGLVKPGLSATAHSRTDRIVLEIARKGVFLFARDEFEAGKTTRDFPMQVIEDAKDNLVASGADLSAARTVTVVTLNRKTGIATWTSILSGGFVSDTTKVEATYLTCGAGRNEPVGAGRVHVFAQPTRLGLRVHLGVRCRRCEPAAAAPHPLAELLALFGRHLVPALHHPVPPVHRVARNAAESAEQDLGQDQQTQSLPKTDRSPAEDIRHQPVPQAHHGKPEGSAEKHCQKRKSQSS
jgi:hypothetical protein